MSSSTIRRASLGIALCIAVPALWALPKQYHLQDLGAGSIGTHINSRGVVAGTDTRSGHHVAVRWFGDQEEELSNPYPAGDALWINDSNVVVGNVDEGYGNGVLWTDRDVFEDIGSALGGAGSGITTVNDKGDCVLWNADGADSSESYLLPKCNLDKLVAVGSDIVAAAINDSDQIAFTSVPFNNEQHAYFYADGHFTDLGQLAGYAQSVASDLNAQAHVVGTSADASFDLREGFFWNGEKMRKVGTLGGERSEANAVNAHDVVVGTAQTRKGSWHAFIRDMTAAGSRPQDLTRMLDASGAGWSLVSAVSINKSGQILVHGTVPGDSAPRSAILTPLD